MIEDDGTETSVEKFDDAALGEEQSFTSVRKRKSASSFFEEVAIINARSRAKAVDWGFGLLGGTIVVGLIAYVVLDGMKLETNTLREWLQTTVASEVGLLAGLLGARDRS